VLTCCYFRVATVEGPARIKALREKKGSAKRNWPGVLGSGVVHPACETGRRAHPHVLGNPGRSA
jgi:hypothetical protein